MGRNALHNWEELLKEYLASQYVTKTDFAKAKGINPSLLRRNTIKIAIIIIEGKSILENIKKIKDFKGWNIPLIDLFLKIFEGKLNQLQAGVNSIAGGNDHEGDG
jgi:hypothetical protein